MRKPARHSPVRKTLLIALSAALALLTVNVALADWGQPNGVTEEADKLHNLYLIVTAAAAVVFVAVEGALIYALIKFRKRSNELPHQMHGNNVLEVIWTGIPIVIVLTLFVFSFIVLQDIEHDGKDENLTIDTQGFQFQWKFTYNKNDLGPGSDKAATGKIEKIGTAVAEPIVLMPMNEPVEFYLHSTDVIHSFYVRDFLYKLDVIPGRDNRFTVTAKEPGTFFGQCAELCGLNHAIMRFEVRVVSRESFDACMVSQEEFDKCTAEDDPFKGAATRQP